MINVLSWQQLKYQCPQVFSGSDKVSSSTYSLALLLTLRLVGQYHDPIGSTRNPKLGIESRRNKSFGRRCCSLAARRSNRQVSVSFAI